MLSVVLSSETCSEEFNCEIGAELAGKIRWLLGEITTMMEGENQVGPTEQAQTSDTVTHGESDAAMTNLKKRTVKR